MKIIQDIVWCAEGLLRWLIGLLAITVSQILDAFGFITASIAVTKFAARQMLKAILIFRSKVLPMDDDLNYELRQTEKELLDAMQNLEE